MRGLPPFYKAQARMSILTSTLTRSP
jgi:hypothetical protein